MEIRSISGFSGSPVFVYDLPFHLQGTRTEQFGQFLLGIDCGHMPGGQSLLRSGVAAVVPAWRIMELLECQQLKEARDENRKQYEGKQKMLKTILSDSAGL